MNNPYSDYSVKDVFVLGDRYSGTVSAKSKDHALSMFIAGLLRGLHKSKDSSVGLHIEKAKSVGGYSIKAISPDSKLSQLIPTKKDADGDSKNQTEFEF